MKYSASLNKKYKTNLKKAAKEFHSKSEITSMVEKQSITLPFKDQTQLICLFISNVITKWTPKP